MTAESPAEDEMTVTFELPDAPASDSGIAVAPLIDIVFLLICFYLIVSQLMENQKDPLVILPAMASPLASVELPADVTINLRQDGLVSVAGRKVAVEQLPALLRQRQALAGSQGRTVRVVVRADRRQSFARLDQILKACQEAGLGQVVFRAQEGGRP